MFSVFFAPDGSKCFCSCIKSVYVEPIVVGKRVLMIEVSDLARERVKSETSINDLIKKKS